MQGPRIILALQSQDEISVQELEDRRHGFRSDFIDRFARQRRLYTMGQGQVRFRRRDRDCDSLRPILRCRWQLVICAARADERPQFDPPQCLQLLHAMRHSADPN